jgi:hypothetical protein
MSGESPHEKISADQWRRWPREAILNTILLSPFIYVPMALHIAWQVWDEDADAALRIVGWPLLIAVVWIAAAYVIFTTVI